MGAFLTRDAILKARDLPTEQVHVPEWLDDDTGADTVLVRGLSAKARDEYLSSLLIIRGGQIVGRDIHNSSAKLVTSCLVGDDGQPLFTQHDLDKLGEKSAAALARVYEVATRLSGLVGDKSLGEDSELIQNGGSTSG